MQLLLFFFPQAAGPGPGAGPVSVEVGHNLPGPGSLTITA